MSFAAFIALLIKLFFKGIVQISPFFFMIILPTIITLYVLTWQPLARLIGLTGALIGAGIVFIVMSGAYRQYEIERRNGHINNQRGGRQ